MSLKGGIVMAESQRLQATLSRVAMERLNQLVAEKGMSKSAVVALAIEKFWKEEHTDSEK